MHSLVELLVVVPVNRWCYPVLNGSPAKKHTYTVQKNVGFLDPGYLALEGAQHTGVDFNSTTGGDSDLGDSVFSVSEGFVVSVGHYSGWGNIVLINHPGGGVYAQYAHLDTMMVKKGQNVSVGQQIGTIGKGDKGRFKAHLHFEIRTKLFEAEYWPSSHYGPTEAARVINMQYVDPIKFLTKVEAIKSYHLL